MLTKPGKLSFSFVLTLLATSSFAGTKTPEMLNPDQITWRELPGHTELQYAVLAGNPLQKGIFTVRLKMPKDYSDIIHTHQLPRYDTVISGAMYVGFGDKIDREKTVELIAGSFISCPADIKHYGFTKDETVVQISGNGPWEVLKSSGKKR